MVLRPLSAQDAGAWRDLRLMALREAPTAFSADDDYYAAEPLQTFAAQIHENPDRFILGAFHAQTLAGVAGFYRCEGRKLRHKANIWAMYVAPAHRGQGLGRRLLDDVLRRARQLPELEQVLIAVTVGNEAAVRLYTACGFQAYGREPRALKVDGRHHDIDHMILRF